MNANSAKRILTIATIFAGSFYAVTAMTVAEAEELGTCYQVKQLEDPTAREFYKSQIAKIKAAAASRFGEVQSNSVQFVTKNGERIEIDEVTFECISCHDGLSASYHGFRFKNDDQTAGGMTSVNGGHPIGSHYGAAAYTRSGLKPMAELHEDMVLVDGRIGCISCHNPLNSEKNHLVKSNTGSDLCLTCHAN
jgi:predicted CXXCH cytochrome family protein